jgi:hypothetical protein
MGMTNNNTDGSHPDELPLPAVQIEAAAEYHRPTAAIPRDAMWAAIQRQRELGARETTHTPASADVVPVLVTRGTRGTLSRLLHSPRFAIAAAAVAVVGIGSTLIQRVPNAPAATVADAENTVPPIAWQVASTEHFGLAESMLTTLSNTVEPDRNRQLSAWSRDLLESTRLMMDSPAGRDPKRRALLEDLELVLVQLVESGPTIRADDRNAMDDLLSRSSLLLTRMRTIVPAGAPGLRK